MSSLTNVVVGAGRPLGAELVRRLVQQGKRARAVVLDREKTQSRYPEDAEVVAVRPEPGSIGEQCVDAEVIFDCFEPHDPERAASAASLTSGLLLPAIEHGSKFVLASHLFNSLADNAASERDVLSAHRSGLTKTVVVRFPQMYGPTVANPLLDGVFESVRRGKKAYWLGALDVPRSFVCLADAVDALLMIASSDSTCGEAWNVAGPAPLTGRQFIEIAFRAAGMKSQVGCWGRGLMFTAGVLDHRAKMVSDLPYDYHSPFVIDGGRFASAFPSFEFTPHEDAIRRALEWRAAHGSETPAAEPSLLTR